MGNLKNNIDHYMKLKGIKMYSHLLVNIAHELGIRFIKGNQFCLSKKKAHLCDLDTTDIERIARQERYVVIDGIMEDTKEECYVLTKKDLL